MKAAEEAGLAVTGIECCPDGRIIVHTAKDRQDDKAETKQAEILL